MHASARSVDLVGERRLARGERLGIRHLEHGGDPAQHRRATAGREIFLVLEPGLAEMDLAVDDPRQDMQSGRINDLAGAPFGYVADGGDAAMPDRQYRQAPRRHD